MEDLIKVNNDLTTTENDNAEISYSKVLNVKSSTPDIDFKGIINQICQYTNIHDVIDKVKKGTEFVVQIPTDFQAGFDDGEYWIMENAKSGKLWPSLMELGEDGRNHIVTPLFLLEKYRNSGHGKAMITHWEKRLKEEGYELVMSSSLANEEAQHFYRKLGYVDSGALLLPEESLEIVFVKKI